MVRTDKELFDWALRALPKKIPKEVIEEANIDYCECLEDGRPTYWVVLKEGWQDGWGASIMHEENLTDLRRELRNIEYKGK